MDINCEFLELKFNCYHLLHTLFTACSVLPTRANALAVVGILNHSCSIAERATVLAHGVTGNVLVTHVIGSTTFKPVAFWNIFMSH